MSCKDISDTRLRAPAPLVFVAAAILIDADGRILLSQRPEGKHMGGFWEFPGGKIQPNETPEAALGRELEEELGLKICLNCFEPFTFASHRYEGFHVLVNVFFCRMWEGTPTSKEGQALAWVHPYQLKEYKFIPSGHSLITKVRDALG